MGVFTRSHKPHGQTVTTTTTTTTRPEGTSGYGRKPTLMQRLKGNHAHKSHTTRTHAAPRAKKTKVARANGTTRNGVPRRKVSVGDKVSGMMLKMKGSLTHRPGEKAAGTRRMHGTDGRGARRVY